MSEFQNKFYLNARDDRAARLRGDRPVGCAWRRAGDRKILKSMVSGDGGACLDFEGEGDALAAAGGLGGVATKRPRASVAVIVPLISSTATESRNAVTAGPLMRGQSAGGAGTESRGYLQ